MAEKRMFSKQVLWSDKFIDLPSPAQVLYFQLSMYADDEGFVNCAGYVRRLTGCSEGDIEALCKNGFIIPFESGVYAIAHWKINNHIRSDRMKRPCSQMSVTCSMSVLTGCIYSIPKKRQSRENQPGKKML